MMEKEEMRKGERLRFLYRRSDRYIYLSERAVRTNVFLRACRTGEVYAKMHER
jgi:hypothetical protein